MILLAEDSEDDALWFQVCLQRANLNYRLNVVMDGLDAIDYLAGNPPFEDRLKYPIPRFFFLDYRLPNADGFDVLRWIKSQPGFSNLKTVLMSGTPKAVDWEKAMQLGAIALIDKELSPDLLAALIHNLELVQKATGSFNVFLAHTT